MADFIIEVIGWVGTILILLAYFLLTSKKVDRDSKIYHGMNLFGGIGIVVNSIANNAYPPAALNIIWSLIAIYGIISGIKFFKRK